jgi:RNA polymerase sigma factor (TIGR02999 family)
MYERLGPDLKKIAQCYFRRERPGHTLQPTALVNEAFIRLQKARQLDWRDRGHFLAISARIMRRFLIDYARGKHGIKLEFPSEEGFPPAVVQQQTPLELAITIDKLLDELGAESPQQRSIVELKYFLGLTDEEVADALDLSLRTMQREWLRARVWLYNKLGGNKHEQQHSAGA